jgi:hypothetical protein
MRSAARQCLHRVAQPALTGDHKVAHGAAVGKEQKKHSLLPQAQDRKRCAAAKDDRETWLRAE